MSVPIDVRSLDIRITAQPLTPSAFAPFGTVIANPRPDILPSAFTTSGPPANAVSANQGTAIQYRRVSPVQNLYSQAPSRHGDQIMSVFVCAARELSPSPRPSALQGDFVVRVLERHPFTSQTFSPLASSAERYLVIVAPSLAPGPRDEGLPVPQGHGLPGRGLPCLHRLRAFVADKTQAVTYAAGTWHAPMVALGEAGTTMDFVVSQASSGVPVEDCQLAEFEVGEEEGVIVSVPKQRVLGKL